MDDKPKEIIKDQPEWMLKSTVTGKVRNIYLDYHMLLQEEVISNLKRG